MIGLLGDDFDFKVLAMPHLGLPGTASNTGELPELRRHLARSDYDLLYLNSFFDREFTIPALVARRLGRIPRRPTILSPMGEFSSGALRLKGGRKRAYLALARRLHLLRDVILHASGPEEAEDIRRTCPWAGGIVVAPDPRALRPLPPHKASADGPLRVVFISRIDRMKNLGYALATLASVRVPIHFDIVGPVTHEDYWRECARLIERAPGHVAVRYVGTIPNSEVSPTLASYDLFFLPTLGENYCHAIVDALEAGTPVLVSDQTPWRDLERQEAGWDLPLADRGAFAAAIERFSEMDEGERMRFRRGARRLAERRIAEDDAVGRNRDMFRSVLATHEPMKPEHLVRRTVPGSTA
jgi:glycosyltransferase involved in cell wall biosynthesis